MAYKENHYYHGSVPPASHCGGSSGQNNAELARRVEELEAKLEALTQTSECCEKLTQVVNTLQEGAVMKEDLVTVNRSDTNQPYFRAIKLGE